MTSVAPNRITGAVRFRLYSLVLTAAIIAGPSLPQGLRIPSCGDGGVRVSIGGILRCVRPVLDVPASPPAGVPSCAASQTLVRSAKAEIVCVASSRQLDEANPICLSGSNPLRLADGTQVCRRPVAQRRVDLLLDLREAKVVNEDTTSGVCNVAPQVLVMVVVVQNNGSDDSPPTRVVFGFPSDAPFRTAFKFLVASDICPGRTVPHRDGRCCTDNSLDLNAYAHPDMRSLNQNASCAVPRLAPRTRFECYAILGRTPAKFPRTDLVDRTTLFARVNSDRAFHETDFTNNEVVTTFRIR